MVQPAGPAGNRHVFLTISLSSNGNTAQRVELVLPERAAYRLGQALAYSSVGLMQEFTLSVDDALIKMAQDFFHLSPEVQAIVLITTPMLRQAQNLIAFCEHCNSEHSEFTFDLLLDHVTGCDPMRTEYILEEPARCPHCKRDVFEKTLVAPHAP
jgi:hypothetical protein